jgi:hypothetical protein
MYRLLDNRKGFVSVLVAVLIVVLFGFAALAIDMGMLVYEKARLQNACDAAALAGAQELPDDTTKAKSKAIEYADKNELSYSEITSIDITEEDRKITVNAERIVPYSFARILGLNQGTTTAQASAENAPINEMGGLRPFGVVDDIFILNTTVVLELGSWDSVGGNFGSLAFDGTGGSVYGDTVEAGSISTWQIGDEVPTQTGNMVGPSTHGIEAIIDQCNHIPACTSDSYQLDCPRIITVPLIDALDDHGSSTVIIVGFARFFIDEVSGGGNVAITGQFLEEVTVGSSDPTDPDFGVRTVKLTE